MSGTTQTAVVSEAPLKGGILWLAAIVLATRTSSPCST
jgi:hypothetical protein